MKGKLIVLNGGSSAGKSTVALEFQELASECWMHLGIDMFWYAIPQSQLDLQQVRPEYYTWDIIVDADGLEWLSVTPGPILDTAMHARYLAIRVYLDAGMNVISDDLIWTRGWLVDLLQTFDGYEVWMVGIHVSDDEGARRESERSGRIAGSNRGSARAAHADVEYDFELDTTEIPIAGAARELHEKYQACRHPGAFGRLRARFCSEFRASTAGNR
jgi:chloramphenicol 3-O phosphotransferase